MSITRACGLFNVTGRLLGSIYIQPACQDLCTKLHGFLPFFPHCCFHGVVWFLCCGVLWCVQVSYSRCLICWRRVRQLRRSAATWWPVSGWMNDWYRCCNRRLPALQHYACFSALFCQPVYLVISTGWHDVTSAPSSGPDPGFGLGGVDFRVAAAGLGWM